MSPHDRLYTRLKQSRLPYCDECIAAEIGVDLEEAKALSTKLRLLVDEFTLWKGHCAKCGQGHVVITRSGIAV